MGPKRKSGANYKASKRVKPTDNDCNSDGNQPSYYLMKAEPNSRIVKGHDVKFSIDDLERLGKDTWEGVRNHVAKNVLKSMKVGDIAFLYHSNVTKKPGPGIAGLMRISKSAFTDATAFDSSHPYYDPKSKPDNPTWVMVEVEFIRRMERYIPLDELKQYKSSELQNMSLLKTSRLSVSHVSKDEFDFIIELEHKTPDSD